ncbi:hypothetical protein EBU24_00370 [bacterium]|nr:hypothetical protein [bacterium]
MFDLFLAASIAFGSESVNAIGLRSKSSCSGGVCSSSAPVAVESKNKVEPKTVCANTQQQSRSRLFIRGKKCR